MAQHGRGAWTRTLIEQQGEAWGDAASQAGSLPSGPVLLTGSGSSYYAALTAAAIGQRLGLTVEARPAADIVTEPAVALKGIKALVAVSRSGRTTEAVWAAEAAVAHGAYVVAATCHPERELAARAHAVWAAPSAEDDTVVMLRSFTSLLVLLQAAMARAAGLRAGLASALQRAWPAWRDQAVRWGEESGAPAPRRAVVLGGGVRWGIALEGMLKATEMSNQVVHAYVPLEYRHGPWGSLTADDAVFVLTQQVTAVHDRQLVADLRRRTPHVVVIGPPSTAGGPEDAGLPRVRRLCYPAGVGDLWAGPLVVVPLQAFAWWWAMASGQDPDAPQNLQPVVKLDA